MTVCRAFIISLLLTAGLACDRAQSPTAVTTPSERVQAMSRLAEEGSADEYVDCFTGKLKAKIEQTREDMTDEEFGAVIRKRAGAVKGVAISNREELADGGVRLRVDWVFADRNEIQTFTLRADGDDWKIAEITDSQYEKPEIPYGTEVY